MPQLAITLPQPAAERRYDILIEGGLIARAGALITERLGQRRAIVVTDENVARHHLATLQTSLAAAGIEAPAVAVTPGERAKDLHRFPDFLEKLLALGVERGTLLIALGGGVVGDLCGFAAASLLRGLDFVQIPTTLLSQIDSSVGGKTGVNARAGKNLVGAFHQPRLVLADLDALDTLPEREWRAGYAEMVKYGLLGDKDFFERLDERADARFGGDRDALAGAIAHCCRMKAEVVAEDEREAGRRALLNLGHTFGHALEAETGFGETLLHGEGVGIGLVLAADLSVRLGRLDERAADRIRGHLERAGVPTRIDALPGALTVERLIGHMGHDKKVSGGRITFILLNAIGSAFTSRDVPREAVEATLRAGGACQ